MYEQKVYFQLVPPHDHHRNPAKHAIQMWKKKHFIAGLCGVDPKFPMNLWCFLLKHCNITLNLLRESIINPKLSAYAQLFGAFDFNQTPLAPSGSKILIYKTPLQQITYSRHGVEGWYLGPAMEHYWCNECYVCRTGGVRFAKTVEFFPHQVPVPALTSREAIHSTALELIKAIKNPQHKTILDIGNEKVRALEKLTNICAEVSKPHQQAAPRVKTTTELIKNIPLPTLPTRVSQLPRVLRKQHRESTHPSQRTPLLQLGPQIRPVTPEPKA